jgi:hypothetical protein
VVDSIGFEMVRDNGKPRKKKSRPEGRPVCPQILRGLFDCGMVERSRRHEMAMQRRLTSAKKNATLGEGGSLGELCDYRVCSGLGPTGSGSSRRVGPLADEQAVRRLESSRRYSQGYSPVRSKKAVDESAQKSG